MTALLACGGDAGTQPSSSLSGAYALQRVGAAPLPYVLARSGSVVGSVVGDTITIDVEHLTFTERYHHEWVSPTSTDASVTVTSGTLRVDGSLLIRNPGGPGITDTATVTTDALTFLWVCSSCNGPTPWVFHR